MALVAELPGHFGNASGANGSQPQQSKTSNRPDVALPELATFSDELDAPCR
ncbi:hypothetical protein NKH18_18660 [Streptomyces sp. M10(2022)]